MSVFINRTLNFKKIKAVGFDMDYTIVRYKELAFEEFAFSEGLRKLVSLKGYPSEILKLTFEAERTIQGLVVDRREGNLLKLSKFNQVKASYHGKNPLDFKVQQRLYGNKIIDLSDRNYATQDTNFSISTGVLISLLVDLKDNGMALPSYMQIYDDIRDCINLSHRDGSLKDEVRRDISKYIIPDEAIARTLERLKSYGKRLFVVTNSDYSYTKLLLDYTFNPFLKEHKDWKELFEVIITASKKPRFFSDDQDFLKVHSDSGLMENWEKPLVSGIFQGGSAKKFQESIGLEGDEILYFGDHIFGDVVSLKKTMNWRTGLVVAPLEEELVALKKGSATQKMIDALMSQKEDLERELQGLYAKEHEKKESVDKKEIAALLEKIKEIDERLSPEIRRYNSYFNPHWGQLMRAGNEESHFAGQVERFACIYMARISDLEEYSPRIYFRPKRRPLAHEE